MADYPIGTQLSYAVFQERTRRGELAAPKLNEFNQRTKDRFVPPVVSVYSERLCTRDSQTEVIRHG